MSDIPTPPRGPVGTRVTVASAVATTLAAVALFGPAVEELREEAARTQRGNSLSRLALAAAPAQADSWSPIWDGPGGAVPDYEIELPPALACLVPRGSGAASRVATSPVAADLKGESADGPGYYPNWDLFEPAGVRREAARWARSAPARASVRPAESVPSRDVQPLPTTVSAAIALE